VIWKSVEFHDGKVVEVSDRIQPIELGSRRACAGIDENVFRRNGAPAAIWQANRNRLEADESRFTKDQIKIFSLSIFDWLPFRKLSTILRLRSRTFARSIRIGP